MKLPPNTPSLKRNPPFESMEEIITYCVEFCAKRENPTFTGVWCWTVGVWQTRHPPGYHHLTDFQDFFAEVCKGLFQEQIQDGMSQYGFVLEHSRELVNLPWKNALTTNTAEGAFQSEQPCDTLGT